MTSESTSEAWAQFVADLALCLSDLNEDEFLVISAKRANYYVQFASQGRFGMRGEAACNSYIEGFGEELSSEDYETMKVLGWKIPTRFPDVVGDPDGSPNFFVDASYPVDFAKLATLTEATFRNVYKRSHPGELKYKAFHSDGDSIRFPTLRLKRDDS